MPVRVVFEPDRSTTVSSPEGRYWRWGHCRQVSCRRTGGNTFWNSHHTGALRRRAQCRYTCSSNPRHTPPPCRVQHLLGRNNLGPHGLVGICKRHRNNTRCLSTHLGMGWLQSHATCMGYLLNHKVVSSSFCALLGSLLVVLLLAPVPRLVCLVLVRKLVARLSFLVLVPMVPGLILQVLVPMAPILPRLSSISQAPPFRRWSWWPWRWLRSWSWSWL